MIFGYFFIYTYYNANKKNIIIFTICLLIIIHHYIKHKNDFHLTVYEKFFQISDIMNHESFVFLFFGIFIGLFISKYINRSNKR